MATELNFGDKVIRNVKGYGYLTHYVIYIDAHEGPSSGDWVEMTGTTDPEILPEDFFRQTAYWRHPRQDELVPFVRRSIP
jgi:hypothetical protein